MPQSSSAPAASSASAAEQVAAWRAVADLYRAWFTGLVLSTITRRGTPRAAEFVHDIFAKQRTEKFLPGLRKLGIDHLPHAVAAAQYHYLSNDIGGVKVEYMPQSDRKAWIRYPVPRWAWTGTALCAIPTEVSRAMLAGWHAQNGVTLGNPRLGFVCTKQAVDGQSGLEGYYYEYDHDLAPHERLRFARHEDAPDFDPQLAPRLPTTTWPAERLARAHRNYAMEYVRTALPVAVNLWGPHEAGALLSITSRLVGMQFHHETAERMGLPADRSAAGFARFLEALLTAQGDACEVDAGQGTSATVSQIGWGLMDAVDGVDSSVAQAWIGLIEGMLSAYNHRLELRGGPSRVAGRFRFDWTIAPAHRPASA
jgi:hypothetical protein